MNWYNYVGSDPINFTDPTGLCGTETIYWDNDGDGKLSDGDDIVQIRVTDCIDDGAAGFNISRFARDLRDTAGDVVDTLDDLRCKLPAVGIGGSLQEFKVVGGGVAGGIQIDPKTGQISINGRLGLGVGAGTAVTGSATLKGNTQGKSALGKPGFDGGFGIAANVQVGPLAGGVAKRLDKNLPTTFSGGLRKGTGATVNATIFGQASFTTDKVDLLKCPN